MKPDPFALYLCANHHKNPYRPDAATLERKTGLCHSSTVRVARRRWHLLARLSALMTGVLLGINTENRAGPVGLDHPAGLVWFPAHTTIKRGKGGGTGAALR